MFPLELLRTSETIARIAHRDKKRKGGAPFISHPEAIVEKIREQHLGWKREAVAWCHDVVEDTAWELTHFKALGFPYWFLKHLGHMTKRPEQVYQKDYIEGVICKCEFCIPIKIFDTGHNMSTLTEEMKARGMMERYEKSMEAMRKTPVRSNL